LKSSTRFLAAVPALAVSDERRAVAFFVDVAGFEEVTHGGRPLGILRRDTVELHLWVPDGSAPGAERDLAGTTSCRIEVSGIEALYERCKSRSAVHPNAPLGEKPWGTREFGILDPDGNLVMFYERIGDAAAET
jgi:catechol 2,3-dioxygenase-like lactoylglutathione lyase family enzyme